MKKNIFIIAASALVAVSILFGCDSSAKKVEEARSDVQTSNENVTTANQDLRKAVNDSITEYNEFRKESEDRIIKYERNLADLKVKIANEKRGEKTKYQKMVAELEIQTAELKKDLNEYKVEGNDQWTKFKHKFNNNMDDLGNSISNFFTSDKNANSKK